MKFNQTLMNTVRKDLNKNNIPMLLGEPGIGKSSWLENLANLMHTKCFTLACNQLADKADLTGARLVPVTNANGETTYKQVFYPHAVIHDAIAYANDHPRETPILFLDELNRTTPDVTSEALSIPTRRSIGSVKFPNNLRVVIAGNDKGNVTSLDTASSSRFVLYRVAPDTQTFLELDPELNVFIKNVLNAHPNCIFAKGTTVRNVSEDSDGTEDLAIEDILDDGDGIVQITTPRTLSGLSRWLNSCTNQELVEMLADTYTEDGETVSALQEIIEGHIGRTDMSTYLLAEIAENAMNVNNQSNNLVIGKPDCYDELKAQTTIDAMNDYVENLTDKEKSACLIYALYEHEDNAVCIQVLSNNTSALEQCDVTALMKLCSSGNLDRENVELLIETQTTLATNLNLILTSFVN